MENAIFFYNDKKNAVFYKNFNFFYYKSTAFEKNVVY